MTEPGPPPEAPSDFDARPDGPYRPPVPPLPSMNDPLQLDAAKRLGWNWGGFLLPYLWLIGHGRVTLGLLLCLSWTIPLLGWLNFLAYPLVGIYLGLNGFTVAWRHQPYHDLEQLQTREREWAVWGFIGIVLLLVGAAFFMAFVAPIYRDVLSNMEGYGW